MQGQGSFRLIDSTGGEDLEIWILLFALPMLFWVTLGKLLGTFVVL